MHPIPPKGVYAISQPGEQLLTQVTPLEGESLVIDQPTGQLGVQEWVVSHGDSGGITLRNLQHNTFAGFEDEPIPGTHIIAQGRPMEFQVEHKGPLPNHFLIYVNKDQERLCVHIAPELIDPPRVSLTSGGSDLTPWHFEFHE